ncbi:unnamed protein product [Symbiodinium sp. CCMP2592]|nr:unnamed protein product [Symbiodinium sp. CCMP2592]
MVQLGHKIKRTASAKSLGSVPTAEDEDPARNFLMSTARKSLQSAFEGSSSDDDTSDSSESVQCDDQADALSAFGLCKKDLVRGENMLRWDDLSCRPFAYVLSCITEQLTAGDVFELGGELEPLHAFVRRLPCFVHSPSC